MKETEQKIKGQWFTPENVADEMVKKNVAFVGNCNDLYTFF